MIRAFYFELFNDFTPAYFFLLFFFCVVKLNQIWPLPWSKTRFSINKVGESIRNERMTLKEIDYFIVLEE